MFSKSMFVAFLALALSVEAVPRAASAQPQCPAPTTVTRVQTVTVTARGGAATATSRVLSNNGNTNNNSGNSGKVTTTASSAKATATTANGKGGNTKTTSSAAAVATAKGGNTKTTSSAAAAATAKGGNTKTTSSSAAAATLANTGGKGNTKTTSSAAAAAATTAANTGSANNGDPQTSTTLDPRVIASGFANNGQDVPTAGQVASLTSTNNFINFCLTVPNLPITNGKQITTGSCNPAPIGTIPSTDNMPSSKFTFPPNFGTIKAGTTFTIEMAIQNMQTGFFVNAQENYFSAPQQLNSAGQIQGHSHVVIESISSLTQTTPTDPTKFAFFKGLNAAAVGGKLTADVTSGLAAGVYKLSSINTAANHQPVIVPVAQHGSLDDAIYFTVTADGQPAAGSNVAAAAASSAAPAASATASASVKGAASSAAPAASAKASAVVKGAASSAAASASAKASAVVKGAASSAAPAASATAAVGRGKNGSSNTAINKNGNNKSPSPIVSSAPAASSSAAVKGGRRRALNRLA